MAKSREMLMTNGTHTVEVVRSAFDDVWSNRGWTEAEEGAVETERVLGLEEGETVEDRQAADAARASEAEAKQAADTAPPARKGGVTPAGDLGKSTPTAP